MLKGCDLSAYNKTTPKGYDFYIIKASEGVGFKSSGLDRHYNNVKKWNKLYGFYHYARPEYNTPEAEADYFLSLVGHHAGKCIYALDYEGTALKYGAGWALRWCRRIFEKTKVRPVLYIQASEVWKYKSLFDEDYGLWIAHWGVYRPQIGPWSHWAFWQYTSNPIDKNYFQYGKATYMKYCRGARDEEREEKC